MNASNDIVTLKDILLVLYKRKLVVLIVGLAVFISVATYTFKLTPLYEAKTTLLIKLGGGDSYRAEVGSKQNLIPFDPEEVISTEIQILKSEDLIEKVVATIGAKNLYPLNKDQQSKSLPKKVVKKKKPEKTLNQIDYAKSRLRKAIKIKTVPKAHVLEIFVEHKSSKLAADVANLLAELFKEKHLQVFSDSKSTFLEGQTKIYGENLQKSIDKLSTFKQKYGVYSFEEQKQSALSRYNDLNNSLKDTSSRINELRLRASYTTEKLATISKEIIISKQTQGNVLENTAKVRLLELELKLRELQGAFKEDSSQIVYLREQIQFITDLLNMQNNKEEERVTTAKNPIYGQLEEQKIEIETEYEGLEALRTSLAEQIKLLEQELTFLERREKEYHALIRDRDNHERHYNVYLNNLEEARISEEMAAKN